MNDICFTAMLLIALAWYAGHSVQPKTITPREQRRKIGRLRKGQLN